MSIANVTADVQALPERMPSETNGAQVTATQIEKDCPARLQQIGREIAERLKKAEKQAKLAADHVIAVDKLLAEAKGLCDGGGFNKFRELFCPQLGKSQAYALRAIAAGKKTLAEHRTEERKRKRKSRANQKAVAASSGTVPEKSEPEAPGAPTEAGAVEPTSIAPEQTPEPTKMPSLGMPCHNVLLEVTARVDGLIRKIGRREPGQFTGIGVETDRIVKLAVFLLDLANHKEPGIVKSMPIIARPDRCTGSAEQSAEDVRTDADLDGRLAALMPKRVDD
jgi:hypothetical protein